MPSIVKGSRLMGWGLAAEESCCRSALEGKAAPDPAWRGSHDGQGRCISRAATSVTSEESHGDVDRVCRAPRRQDRFEGWQEAVTLQPEG